MPNRNKTGILPLLVLLVPTMGYTATLPDTLSAQLRQHPSVIELDLQSHARELAAAASMGLPNPKLELGVNNLPIENPAFDRYLPTNKSIALSQLIPGQGKRNSRRLEQLSLSKLEHLKAEDRLAELELKALRALANLQKIETLRPLLEQQRHHYDELDEWLKGELEAGGERYARFAELDVQRSELDLQMNELDEEESQLKGELYYLFNDLPDFRPSMSALPTWNGESGPIIPLRVAQQQIAVAESTVKVKTSELDLDYSFALTYQQRDEGSNFDGDDWITLKFGISLPLWKQTNQLPQRDMAQMQLAAERLKFDNQRRTINQSLQNLYADIETAQERERLLRQKRTRLKRQQSAMESRYESGDSDLEPLVRMQIAQLAIAMQQVRLHSRIIILSSQIYRYFHKESS